MSELLYTTDSYVKEFEARVVEQVDGGVVLDRTAFYPGGGGQPGDVGTLSAGGSTWTVTAVKKVDGRPAHFIEGELPPVGTAVDAGDVIGIDERPAQLFALVTEVMTQIETFQWDFLGGQRVELPDCVGGHRSSAGV